MSAGNRVPTDGGPPLGQRPFAGLGAGILADTGNRIPDTGAQELAGKGQRADQKREDPNPPIRDPVTGIRNPQGRGRVDITRQTAGRGGKTVTVVSGFTGIGQTEKEQLAKRMQKACGAGGTVKEGRIEIQGDQREQVARVLAEAGFRPVLAGG